MKRFLYFSLLLVAGLLVYFVGGYWSGIPFGSRTIIKVTLPALILLTLAVLRHTGANDRRRRLAVALLAASVGFLVCWLLADPIRVVLGVEPDSVPGIALTKFVEASLIVIPVLVTARLGGFTRSDLFLSRGRARAWLAVGLVSLFAFTVLYVLQSVAMGLPVQRLLTWTPWTLLFVFSNSFMEELHFRGLLLRPVEAFLGRSGANLCVALCFTLVHAPVTYTSDVVLFLVVLFVLAFAWGYVIRQTDALWGAVLFHAGADLLIVVEVYRTHGATP